MHHMIYQTALTLGILAFVLFVLVVGTATGLIVTKRRIKRPLPGNDRHVEG